VEIISDHPTQWEGPFFGYLQANSSLDVHVFYNNRQGLGVEIESESKILVKHDIPGLVNGYDHTFLDEFGSSEGVFEKVSESGQFDVFIVEGHVGELQKVAMKWGKKRKIPIVYRSDSNLLYDSPLWKRIIKKFLLPHFFKQFSAFIALSTPAAEYLRHYRAPDKKIFLSTYMVHNEWFESESNRWRQNREAIKRELGLGGFSKLVLAILRFEERENPIEFLQVAAIYKGWVPKVGFVLIGDGTRREEVEKFVKREGLDNVVLPGYLSLSALPKYYAISDVFVHPARKECWGLSVNEAMACGVPVVISTGLGCRYDLVPSDQYGLVYPVGDPNKLAKAIRKILEDNKRANAIGHAAKERVNFFSYLNAAKTFESAVGYAIQKEGDGGGVS